MLILRKIFKLAIRQKNLIINKEINTIKMFSGRFVPNMGFHQVYKRLFKKKCMRP